jgi:predicted nucleic acid-binding protein
MELVTYFFDTYALYEYVEGSDNYKRFTSVVILTTQLNLMELYYGLLVKYDKTRAEFYYSLFSPYVIELDDTTIKEAMFFRKEFRKRNLSYIDCLGYIMAKRRGVKFLTGDKEFEDMDNVEFVK